MFSSPQIRSAIHSVLLALFFTASIFAQSSDQNFPTPVTSNEIVGTIKARDIGDSRLTTFYYAFEGVQGDVFINVVTKNFVGDIDVFARDGLRPLSKIVVFDAGVNETGRLIYLRKAERLLLRIQGRTPGDDSASFRIKFAGSFVALAAKPDDSAPKLTPTNQENSVNSVGTKLPAAAKEVEQTRPSKAAADVEQNPREKTAAKEKQPTLKKEPVAARSEPEPAKKPADKKTVTAANPEKSEKKVSSSSAAKASEADPLAGIKLVILLKDGSLIERSMTEVQRFTVDKGILIVSLKNGDLSRFPLTQVTRVTIE